MILEVKNLVKPNIVKTRGVYLNESHTIVLEQMSCSEKSYLLL